MQLQQGLDVQNLKLAKLAVTQGLDHSERVRGKDL